MQRSPKRERYPSRLHNTRANRDPHACCEYGAWGYCRIPYLCKGTREVHPGQAGLKQASSNASGVPLEHPPPHVVCMYLCSRCLGIRRTTGQCVSLHALCSTSSPPFSSQSAIPLESLHLRPCGLVINGEGTPPSKPPAPRIPAVVKSVWGPQDRQKELNSRVDCRHADHPRAT
jgi:hypothetical protein